MNLYFFPFPFGGSLYDESIMLRTEILREPLRLEFTVEQLSEEYKHIHFGAFSMDLELLGILVLVPLGNGRIKMRQVAIPSALQGKGIGSELVRASEKYCLTIGYNTIELNARETAVPFYLNLGYSIEGEKFLEVGIPHFKMYRNIRDYK